jgi:hypothetical protein
MNAIDRLLDVGGCRLHFSVIQGLETVIILEVGGGADSSQWGLFPQYLAQETSETVVT